MKIEITCSICGKPKLVDADLYKKGGGRKHASCHRKWLKMTRIYKTKG